MKRAILSAALAVLVTVTAAEAQRSQALCSRDTDGVVDGASCVEMNFRMFSGTALKGIEEDAIIGIGSADVTLTRAQIASLDTTRVVLVPAPGAGKYLFVDWVVLSKTDTDGVPAGTATSWIYINVAPQTGGTWPGLSPVTFIASGAVFGSQVWVDGGSFLQRSTTTSFVGTNGIANTPIVVGAIASTGSNWSDVAAQLDQSVTLRIIVRYRIIDTADTF